MVNISQAHEPSRVKSKNEGLIPFNTITIFFLLLHKENSSDSFLAIYPNNSATIHPPELFRALERHKRSAPHKEQGHSFKWLLIDKHHHKHSSIQSSIPSTLPSCMHAMRTHGTQATIHPIILQSTPSHGEQHASDWPNIIPWLMVTN